MKIQQVNTQTFGIKFSNEFARFVKDHSQLCINDANPLYKYPNLVKTLTEIKSFPKNDILDIYESQYFPQVIVFKTNERTGIQYSERMNKDTGLFKNILKFLKETN